MWCSPNTSPSLLWETDKAVLRGRIISYSTYKKKKDIELELKLEGKITTTQFLLERLRHNKLQYDNKSSKYLVNLVKHNKEKSTITVIRDSAGKPLHDSKDIKKIFRNLYKNLYTSDHNPNVDDIHKFLSTIHQN